MLSNPERLAADLRASEAADAMGLGYRHSRAMLWRILHGQVSEPPPSAFLQQCFDYGKWAEPWTRAAYEWIFRLHVLSSRTHFGKLGSKTIAATPDAEGAGGIVVEFKSKMRGSEMPNEPKAAHVAQVVVQMWAAKHQRGDLFYFNLWNGAYRCFHMHWNAEGWSLEVRHWLREFFSYVDRPPPRMPSGEADRRTTILLFAFWWDRHGTVATGLGALKRNRGEASGSSSGEDQRGH
jgi:hypothetical protein